MTKSYITANDTKTGGLHVIDMNGNDCGGPYKNEESAKRRIRDLKRKETASSEANAEIKGDGDIGTKCITAQIASELHHEMARGPTHEFVETPDKCEPLPDLREIATGKIISALTVPTPNVEKLAASSAYGKTHHPNGNISMPIKKAPPWFGKDALVRQVGCYPHVSKRAYQR